MTLFDLWYLVPGAFAVLAVFSAYKLVRSFISKPKRKPKTRELVTRLNFNLAPMTGSMQKASEAMRKIQQGMRHAHCRSVMVPEPVGPPAILCSSCGDTLKRNGDHFDCTGCGRQVRP